MIPALTDPMGKYWRQPDDIRSAPMDGKHVLLSRSQFQGLNEYSASHPSGVYPGKCWRRQEGRINLLVWYGETSDPKKCSIEFREIRIGRLKEVHT